MKIKELIEKLQQYDPELTVLVNGYEMGYNAIEAENIQMKSVIDNKIMCMCGRYEDYDSYIDNLGDDEVLKDSIVAVVIGR